MARHLIILPDRLTDLLSQAQSETGQSADQIVAAALDTHFRSHAKDARTAPRSETDLLSAVHVQPFDRFDVCLSYKTGRYLVRHIRRNRATKSDDVVIVADRPTKAAATKAMRALQREEGQVRSEFWAGEHERVFGALNAQAQGTAA